MVKDDFDLSTIPSGAQLMLIGTAGVLVAADAPAPKVIFAEDLGEEERRRFIPTVPAGLTNLGNTCYANSILQVLFGCTELCEGLENFLKALEAVPGLTSISMPPQRKLVIATARLFRRLRAASGTEAIVPIDFIAALRLAVPRFNEVASDIGVHAQQDADECLSALMDALASGLKPNGTTTPSASSSEKDNVVDALFAFRTGIVSALSDREIKAENARLMAEYEALSKSDTVVNEGNNAKKARVLEDDTKLREGDSPTGEASKTAATPSTSTLTSSLSLSPPQLLTAETEPASVQIELARKLTVSIDASTNSMVEGLQVSMNEEVEKRSTVLGRTATYTRTHRMLELPKQLLVRFNRFSWRQDIKKKAKIVRRVVFPLEYDAFELTGGPLRAALLKKREEAADKKSAQIKRMAEGGSSANTTHAVKMTDDVSSSDAGTHASTNLVDRMLNEAGVGVSDSNEKLVSTGRYALSGVVTHKGRGADAGHYIGWRKTEKGVWYKFNDDVVTEVRAEEIERLCGGGDLDTAYIILYARIDDLIPAASTAVDK